MTIENPTKPTRFGEGFTLVELLIAIAVLGVLITMAVPAFDAFLDRHRLKSAVEVAYQDLQTARSEALKRNTEVRVSFVTATTNNPWCYGLKDEATSCDCNETNSGAADYCEIGGTPRIVSGSDYPGAQLTSDADITFEPRRGTASNDTVTFNSDDGSHNANIVVSTLGRVRICSDSDSMGYPGC